MPLETPNLDDRRFDDLVAEAKRLIMLRCPSWTDLTPGDPGMVMVELFAHLTEVMIYRLNRVPEKAYIEFLRLIGVQLQPPVAAAVELQFTLARPREQALEIPLGTRVAATRGGRDGEPPIFVTTKSATIEAGEQAVKVHALNCEPVLGELAGQGTGMPGLCVQAARPPLIHPTGDGLDLVVGVEALTEELEINTPAIHHEGKTFRIWSERNNFSDLQLDRHAYTVDRLSGVIHFAPAVRLRDDKDGILNTLPEALAEVPAAGREIRLWYRRGGGVQGNVAANSIKTLKETIPGVEVVNPAPALGGRDAEPLDNALLRGPHELHSLQRAVTARDFELLAVSGSGAVNRAKVYARAGLWAHARPGTVEVLLVPEIPPESREGGYVSHDTLLAHESDDARENILSQIDERRPLGVMCRVNWVRYKPISIEARVVIRREEDRDAVAQRVLRNLHDTVNPLAIRGGASGWPFGKSLKAWDVYKVIGTEPGVVSVDEVRLAVDDAPEGAVRQIAADHYQANTWYAVRGQTIYRSMNDGIGWEALIEFPDEEVELVLTYPRPESGPGQPGLLAVCNRVEESNGSRVHVSRDCGESWQSLRLVIDYHIDGMAWIDRDGLPSLLWATDNGLYEQTLAPGAVPQKILVKAEDQDLGFYAVTVSNSATGGTYVAVAARQRGVFLSAVGGKADSFANIGLEKELVPVLAVQQSGPHRYLWAGLGAPGTDKGKGVSRWLLIEDNPEGWVSFSDGWEAGGCRSLAFIDSKVYAASLRLGVLSLDLGEKNPRWHPSDINCGLPAAEVGRLQPVEVVASNEAAEWLLCSPLDKGVYRSGNGGATFVHCSSPVYSDEVTVPENWILCSGRHNIRVEREDEG
jgi:hypothetical protein